MYRKEVAVVSCEVKLSRWIRRIFYLLARVLLMVLTELSAGGRMKRYKHELNFV